MSHLVAATRNAVFVEFFPGQAIFNFRRLIDRQPEMNNGDHLLPKETGLGFAFDEDAVRRFGLGDWSTIGHA